MAASNVLFEWNNTRPEPCTDRHGRSISESDDVGTYISPLPGREHFTRRIFYSCNRLSAVLGDDLADDLASITIEDIGIAGVVSLENQGVHIRHAVFPSREYAKVSVKPSGVRDHFLYGQGKNVKSSRSSFKWVGLTLWSAAVESGAFRHDLCTVCEVPDD